MAGNDKKAGDVIETDIDNVLDNAAATASITPAAHNQILEDAFKTAFFANATKFVIIPSGDPAAGEISLDGDDFDTATTIKISKTDDHANNISLMLGLVVKNYVIQLKDYEGNFGEFTVNTISDSGTFYTLTVTASGSNPSVTPTSLEGMLRIFTNNTAFSGIYGGSGSLPSSVNVTMASYLLNFVGSFSTYAQIKDGKITSGDTSQGVYLEGSNNRIGSQSTTLGHGEHNLNFQDNPNVTPVDITLPLESGVVIVIPQANSIIANPTASEDGYAIVWDDTAGEYTLAPN